MAQSIDSNISSTNGDGNVAVHLSSDNYNKSKTASVLTMICWVGKSSQFTI